MQADERTRTVTHHEWVLPSPAHHSEVAKALAVANQKRQAEPGYPTDIEFTHGDDEIVIGYSVAVQPGPVGEAVDQILRAERDESRRKAEFTMATVQRVRGLAIEWSAATGSDAASWRQASMLLHAALDGPDDEPGTPDPAQRIREFEDLLASLWLYIGRHTVKQLETGQKNLLADSVDAARARLAEADPAYGEASRVERWWDE